MTQLKEGQSVPNATVTVIEKGTKAEVSSSDLFAGKNVVLFALPGAFTPTCSSTHLPRFNELAPVFAQEGIDKIYCLSVNDAFVMEAWAADQHADNVAFVADGNGEFSRGMGMLVDKTENGMGERSWRYAMLVKDGVIEKMFVEPNKPGDPFEVSDADTMLNYINASAQLPQRVAILTKPGCPHCARAKTLLKDKGYRYEEIELGQDGLSYSTLVAISGATTTPQVYIEGQRIGGADDLEQWFKNNNV
ncbi:MAG TPA: glutathione peroxidase [Alcanivoracaceae bacterium]|nr:glutathione peroxidase [Alcanivoracaceae bacterium]